MGKFHNEIPPLFGHRLSRAAAPMSAALDETDSLAAELVAATVAKFDIIGVLGRGELASVYLAIDVSLQRQVAIKVIPLAAREDAEAADQFRREAKLLGSLNHAHIVPVYRINQVGRLVYFVMRYIDGCGLDRIVAEHGPLPIDVTRLIVGEVADGLDLSHEYGILHRDVKPANILIGRDGVPSVSDFGFAQLSRALTQTVVRKTPDMPYYMSPEQCGGGAATAASDQYSLAAVAYEMLAGHPPFDGPSAAELRHAHVAETPTPLGDLRDGLPPALCGAVHRALNKHPADRWPTIAAFAMAVASEVMANRDAVRVNVAALVPASAATDGLPPARPPAAAAAAEKKRPRQSRRAKRRARRVRTVIVLGLTVAAVVAAAMIPRVLRRRAAEARIAARIRDALRDTAGAVAGTARVDRDVRAPGDRAGSPAQPMRVLGTPASCKMLPPLATQDLRRRKRALVRVCVSLDRTSVTIGGTALGVTTSGVWDVEVAPGTVAYSTQRLGCRKTEGTVVVVAGEYHVVAASRANPICTGAAATRQP